MCKVNIELSLLFSTNGKHLKFSNWQFKGLYSYFWTRNQSIEYLCYLSFGWSNYQEVQIPTSKNLKENTE